MLEPAFIWRIMLETAFKLTIQQYAQVRKLCNEIIKQQILFNESLWNCRIRFKGQR